MKIRLDSLDARLGVSEVALRPIRTPTLTPPTTTTATAALDDLRNKVDAVDLHMKNELASFGSCKARLVALEKHHGKAASPELRKRLGSLEENYNKMLSDHSDMAAKCVTHEQFAVARNHLAASL